ncbi:MAG: DoxX family membrane protein [Bacteroidales bacterium]|nr:DoxX family membrane protein [Bacteroidales bacterium]
MLAENTLKSFIRIMVGLILIISAIAKLVSIDSFEIYVYSFGLLNLNLAFFLARLIISFELLTGLLLIFGKYQKQVVLASVLMLVMFSAFIVSLILGGKNEHCHCFGETEMSHGFSLIKNGLLIVLLLYSKKSIVFRFRFDNIVLVSLLVLSILLPFTITPPDSFFYDKYSKSVSYNDLLLNEYLREQKDYQKGRKILCFFSTGCRFCKLAARKVTVMAKKAENADAVKYIFSGSESSIGRFFKETHSTVFQYSFLPPKRFLRITNGEMPLIVLLEDGVVKGRYGYRDMKDSEIINFIKE